MNTDWLHFFLTCTYIFKKQIRNCGRETPWGLGPLHDQERSWTLAKPALNEVPTPSRCFKLWVRACCISGVYGQILISFTCPQAGRAALCLCHGTGPESLKMDTCKDSVKAAILNFYPESSQTQEVFPRGSGLFPLTSCSL